MRPWPALLAAVAVPAISMLAVSDASAAPVRPGQERPVPSPLSDRFALRGSFFTSQPTTRLRLDSTASTTGTLISAEDDFGLDDDIQQGRIELTFRLGKRNKLRVDYFKLDRYAGVALPRTLQFGDNTFNAGELVTSSVDYRVLTFTDTISVFRRENFEAGVGLGISAVEAALRGEVPARQAREEATGTAPFPTIALDTVWRFTERFSFSARAQYFSATVGDISGLMSDYHGDVQFRWRPNVAFGLGWTALRTNLDVQDDDFPGRFALKVTGPEAFVRVSF
jgi:hypothetical protein